MKGARAALKLRPDLTAATGNGGREWVVIGGNSKGGIVVRTGIGLTSPECRSRLATGSVIEELEMVCDRVHYRRIAGSGPDFGWVSLNAFGRALLRLKEEERQQEEKDVSTASSEQEDMVVGEAHAPEVQSAESSPLGRDLYDGQVDADCLGFTPQLDDGLLLHFFDWQKGAYASWDCSDSLSLIERLQEPLDVFCVAASWNDWDLEEMVQDRSSEYHYYLDLRLPTSGGFFQIVVNRDWKQVLYPSRKQATSEACDVLGPDDGGHGYSWALEGSRGDVVRVQLRLSGASGSREVSWKWLRHEPVVGTEPVRLFRPRYFIVGSWTDWGRKQSMRWTSECYEYIVEVGAGGVEAFQLLEEANWKKRLHPDVRNASPHEPHTLVGPDPEKATGLNWKIGQHPWDEAAPGAHYAVRLYVDSRGPCRVSWERQEDASPRADAEADFWVVGHEAGRDKKDIPVFTSAPGLLRLPKPVAPPRSLDLRRIPGAFALDGVMNPEECMRLVALSERIGYSVDSSMAAGRGVRESETCTLLADSLMNDELFERCRPFLPPLVDGGQLAGLNRRWRLYRYPAFGTFKPHVDGSWPGSGLDQSGRLVADAWEDRWSHLSCLVYLNDDFRGGATRFFLPEGRGRPAEAPYRVEEVRPKCGSALFFFHGEHPMSPVHEGARIASGTKYVLRTDVLYMLPADRQSGQNFWQERFAGLSKCL